MSWPLEVSVTVVMGSAYGNPTYALIPLLDWFSTLLAGGEHWRGSEQLRSARGGRGTRCFGHLAPDLIHLLQP